MKQIDALEILKSGENVFLTGEPGAGKTYTINLFTEWLDDNRKGYAVTASTGIAASHIDGSTIHAWAGMGINSNLDEYDLNAIRFHKYHYNRIIAAEVLILDEVSMLSATFITDLDNVLQAVHKNERPFGGIQVVMVGDFFQLPPVSRGTKPQFAFESPSWDRAEFMCCYLTEQHRQSDPIFTEILTSMRAGTMSEDQKNILRDCQNSPESETTLFTHNQDVDVMNDKKLAEIKMEAHTFKMLSDGNEYAIKTLKKNCLSPETLVLKVGAVVMFTANKPDSGYMNGTVGVVKSFDNNGVPLIELKDGRIVYPEENTWKAYDENKSVKAFIKQYPLRLAWSITVHKSQGMSLDTASIDLSKAFEYGHGYVAFSRVRGLDGLHLIGLSEGAFAVNPKVLEKDKEFRAS